MKATETSSIHLVKEMVKEADSFARKEVCIKAKISSGDPVLPPPPFDRISSSSLKEMVCRSVEAGWNEEANKKSNRQGKDPKTQKETSQEGTRAPCTSPPWDQGGRKQVRCIPVGGVNR